MSVYIMEKFKIWKKDNIIMCLQKSYKTFQNRRTVYISAQNEVCCDNMNGKQMENKIVMNQKENWNKIISEAKKIVGYPTSSLNLRWLLSEEIANIALHLRKIVELNYSTVNIAKFDIQMYGLILLLISKTAGHLNIKTIEEDKITGILHGQRVLAEIIELIRISNLIHRGLIKITTEFLESSKLNNTICSYKMALLCGDYLFSNSFIKLAALRNQNITFLIFTAIKDTCQAEFMARRDNENFPIPSIPPENRMGYALREWTLLNTYSSGSLLGNGCQSTLKIAGHSKEIEAKGYEFGKHLALAWQAALDLNLCINKDKNILFNLCAAPIMFHIEHDPSLLIELDKGLESVRNVDYLKVLEIVADGPGIELTKNLIKKHSQEAIEILKIFEKIDAREVLSNIILAISDFY